MAPEPPPPPLILTLLTLVTLPCWSTVICGLCVALPYTPGVTAVFAKSIVASPDVAPPLKPTPATTLVMSPLPPPPLTVVNVNEPLPSVVSTCPFVPSEPTSVRLSKLVAPLAFANTLLKSIVLPPLIVTTFDELLMLNV